jgi:hypothetical protein
MVGNEREALGFGHVRWTDLKRAERRDRYERTLAESHATRAVLMERKRVDQLCGRAKRRSTTVPKPRPIWLWEIDLGYKFTPVTENAVGSDPSDRIGKAGGITYSILKRNWKKWRLV